MRLSKHASTTVRFATLAHEYGAEVFIAALKRYIAVTNNPSLTRLQLEDALDGVILRFGKVKVWHRIKFVAQDRVTRKKTTVDSVHARPPRKTRRGILIPGRFDTALFNLNDGNGAETGIQGNRVGRVRVVFSLPDAALPALFNPEVQVPKHLAYVEWYTPFPSRPERDHLMYKTYSIGLVHARILCLVFQLKYELVAELAACPRIYEILIKLWVDQDISKTMGPGEWTKDFHTTLVRALCLATTDWRPTGRPPVPDDHSVACFTSLPGLKPRQFIRVALHVVQALLNGGFDELIKTTYLNVISLFANDVFSIRRPPRDAVRCIVDILRGILDQPCSHALASVAFSILWGMWLADETGRSVAWSVRDGVVLVLHSLYRKRPDKIWVGALSHIASRAIHIPVICALRAAGDLWLDGEETSADILSIRGCIEERAAVYEAYPVPICENERCLRDSTTPLLRKHRSACCGIPYCSIDCQRAAWAEHKARCLARNQDTSSECAGLWYGGSSWSSLCFAKFCAHNVLVTHMRRILQLPPELNGPGPRTPMSVPRYFLSIDMTAVPPTCKVSVTFPEHPEVTEAKVEFYAQVFAVGGMEKQLVHVLDASLPMLKAAYAPDFTPFQLG